MTSLVAAGYGCSSSEDDNSDKETNEEDECDKGENIKYESSIDSEDSDDDQNNEYIQKSLNSAIAKDAVPLPSASSILATSAQGLVFNNPFKLAENAKIASLEKHVKMVDSQEKTKVINGKKICWNFRKGRCRFGSNCTYAHDSDLHRPEDALQQPNSDPKSNTFDGTIVRKSAQSTSSSSSLPSNGSQNKNQKQGKKRPGMSNTLVPNKKVMDQYHSLKTSK